MTQRSLKKNSPEKQTSLPIYLGKKRNQLETKGETIIQPNNFQTANI